MSTTPPHPIDKLTLPLTPYSYSPQGLLKNYQNTLFQQQSHADHKEGSSHKGMIPRRSDDENDQNDTRWSLHYNRSRSHCGSNSDHSILKIAVAQLTGSNLPKNDVRGFCDRAEQALFEAVDTYGAHLVLLPELCFSGPYFCQSQSAPLLALAQEINHQHYIVSRMQHMARTLHVVLPISLYERRNQALYNSVVMIDADGTIVGTYRKTHIPDGPGYQEKFYFTPGDNDFPVFDTHAGKIGVAICWDQWFPEVARCLALQGADVIVYPTAIGSEPHNPTLYSADHWQRVMQGHAAANMVPIVASNRFGTEILLKDRDEDDDHDHDDPNGKGDEEVQRIHFYGRSFITDHTGAKIAECIDNDDDTTTITTDTENSRTTGQRHGHAVTMVAAEINVEQNRRERLAWGLFRDRRPDLYTLLLTKDGVVKP